MTDNPQSPIPNPQSDDPQSPALDFCGVRIFASREADRVTGRVEYPEPFNREPCPLAYRRTEPPSNPQAPTSKPQSKRLTAVHHYQDLIATYPCMSKHKLAQRTATVFDVTTRSIQLWLRKLELGGEEALADATPPRVYGGPVCSAAVAGDALLICAWWSFRIQNCKSIDNLMMVRTVALLERGFSKADIIATIDCYFAWPCDRGRFPFKRFSNWVQYNFEKWLYRARTDADYRQAVAAAKSQVAPLHLPSSDQPSAISQQPAKFRRRLANNRATREAIAALNPQSPIPNPQSHDPQSAAESLLHLDDAYRTMLLDAARGDRARRSEAIATVAIWWPLMHSGVTHNIDSSVQAWATDHPRVSPRNLAARRVDMFLAGLRRGRHHPERLGVAARFPV